MKKFVIEISRFRPSFVQIRGYMDCMGLSGMRIHVHGRYDECDFDCIDVLKIFDVMRFYAVKGSRCFEIPWFLTLHGRYTCEKLA